MHDAAQHDAAQSKLAIEIKIMKINPNATKLADLVETVNGAAQAHTFTADEVRLSIQKAVCRMRDIGVAKKDYHYYTVMLFSGDVRVDFTKSGEPRVSGFEKLSTSSKGKSLTQIFLKTLQHN